MKIHSKFKDYYDIGMSQGTQEGIFFNRETINPNIQSKKLLKLSVEMCEYLENISDVFYNNHFSLYPFIVAFCGKLYPGVYLIKHKDVSDAAQQPENLNTYFYSLDSLLAYFKKKDIEVKSFKPTKWDFWLDKKRKRDFTKIFKLVNPNQFQDTLISNKITTAVVSSFSNKEGFHFSIDLPLKDVEFFKKFDSWQAYQEISMYLGGVLTPEAKPMLKTEDKYKISSHGFDKMSFRKYPSKTH